MFSAKSGMTVTHASELDTSFKASHICGLSFFSLHNPRLILICSCRCPQREGGVFWASGTKKACTIFLAVLLQFLHFFRKFHIFLKISLRGLVFRVKLITHVLQPIYSAFRTISNFTNRLGIVRVMFEILSLSTSSPADKKYGSTLPTN